jgi:hypothetical protein
MAEVEVGFRPVFRHEHFTVLEGAHRPWIDVDVRIQLQQSNPEAARFEQRSHGRGSDSLTQGGNHPARDEHEFCHGGSGNREYINRLATIVASAS